MAAQRREPDHLDLLYSDFDAKRDENFLEAFSFSRTAAQGGKPQTIVANGEIDGNGTLVYGLFDDVDIRSESRYDELETDFLPVTLSAEHELSDNWSINELFGTRSSDFNNPIQTTITLDRSNSDGYSWDLPRQQPPAGIQLQLRRDQSGQLELPALSAAVPSEIRLRPQGVDNTFQVGKIDLKFAAIGRPRRSSCGLDYKKYDFESWEQRRASETTRAGAAGRHDARRHDRAAHRLRQRPRRPSGTPTQLADPEPRRVRGHRSTSTATAALFALGDISVAAARGNNRSVRRRRPGRLPAGRLQHRLWASRFAATSACAMSKPSMTSQGYSTDGAPRLMTSCNEYDDTLPSLNLVADLTPDLLLRFGAAKVMTRPALGTVTPGRAVNISLVGNLHGHRRQPAARAVPRQDLRPRPRVVLRRRLAALGRGLLQGHRHLRADRCVETVPFNDVRAARSACWPAPTLTGDEVFHFTIPVNTEGGPLKGFEINYQQPFTFLPGFWSNFGTLLNYTYVDSTIDYVTSTTGATPPRQERPRRTCRRTPGTRRCTTKATASAPRRRRAYRDGYLTRGAGRSQRNDDPGRGRHERNAVRRPVRLVRDQRPLRPSRSRR